MNIELINDDCLVAMKNLADKSVDISFTSPPYNRKRNDKYDNYEDTIDDYYTFLCNSIDELLRVTKRYVFFNIQTTYYNKVDVYKLIGKYADKIQQIFVWEKTNPMPSSANSITNAYEIFIAFGDEPIKAKYSYVKNHISTSVNTETTSDIHKAVMKQEVADWFIDNFTVDGDTVLDCFMGLGTTCISCKKYGRNFIGIEIDKDYFEMAKSRIESIGMIKKKLW